MTVDGAWQAMRPGSYAGAIILKVTPLKVFGGTALGPRMLPQPTDPHPRSTYFSGEAASVDAAFPASYDTITTHLQ